MMVVTDTLPSVYASLTKAMVAYTAFAHVILNFGILYL